MGVLMPLVHGMRSLPKGAYGLHSPLLPLLYSFFSSLASSHMNSEDDLDYKRGYEVGRARGRRGQRTDGNERVANHFSFVFASFV